MFSRIDLLQGDVAWSMLVDSDQTNGAEIAVWICI